MNINIDSDKFVPSANRSADAEYLDAQTNRYDFWFRVIAFAALLTLQLSTIAALAYGAITLISK